MLIASFPSGPWQANCYLVSPREGADHPRDELSAPCVVIDPGVDSHEELEQQLAEHHLVPQAVLLTHGHIDHVAGAQPFADAHDLPVYLHPADEHLMSDPAAGLGAQSRALLDQLGLARLTPPRRLENLADGQQLSLAGLDFDFVHAPGHTAGCTLLRLRDTPHGPVVFSGDVIFAGSIGRLDLPGGDEHAMHHTLSQVVLPLADATHLLPGHGATTTMARERSSNPYLTENYLAGGLV